VGKVHIAVCFVLVLDLIHVKSNSLVTRWALLPFGGGWGGVACSARMGWTADAAAHDTSENLTQLANVNVGSVVEALKARALRGDIYSRCGPLLLAENPYRQLPIYGDEQLQQYLSSAESTSLPPMSTALARWWCKRSA
jgi:hypothetical protein